jgi:hypothetical protein
MVKGLYAEYIRNHEAAVSMKNITNSRAVLLFLGGEAMIQLGNYFNMWLQPGNVLDLHSYLIMPVGRIPRYIMLFQVTPFFYRTSSVCGLLPAI